MNTQLMGLLRTQKIRQQMDERKEVKNIIRVPIEERDFQEQVFIIKYINSEKQIEVIRDIKNEQVTNIMRHMNAQTINMREEINK